MWQLIVTWIIMFGCGAQTSLTTLEATFNSRTECVRAAGLTPKRPAEIGLAYTIPLVSCEPGFPEPATGDSDA